MKKIIILLVFILAICCIGVFLYINNKGMTKEEFGNLIKSFENVSNVKIEEKQISKDNLISDKLQILSIRYIKDGRMLVKEENDIEKHTWSDYNTKECIIYSPSLKQYEIGEYNEFDISQWDDIEYKFIGYEKCNRTKCAVAQLRFTHNELTTTMWVDIQNGMFLKVRNKGIDSWGEEYELINEYTPTYGVVTDEDVKRPDLEGYTQLEH